MRKLEWKTEKRAGILLNNPAGKNLPSIWCIQSEPHNWRRELGVESDHFAAFPQALVETPIKAACPEFVCTKCGKARERISKNEYQEDRTGGRGNKHQDKESKTGAYLDNLARLSASHTTIGWTDCGCGAPFTGGIVLDPFLGSGTTALVAKKLGRHFIGIELNPKYIEIAEKRLAGLSGNLFV